MNVLKRFLHYTSFDTASDGASETSPSTEKQRRLGETLLDEMIALGFKDACMSPQGYVYGRIPASPGFENKPVLGFIAHMDTSSECSGAQVKPRVIENYDGEDVPLGDGERVLTRADFPHLPALRGRKLIVTDGTTLLGADDKAGIAEIMTAAEILLKGEMPHGEIAVAFTPDEEIGRGTDFFDLARFHADFGYTVDGGAEGEVEYENFNACRAVFEISGKSVHPGSAKNVMVNASLVAMEINAMLPEKEIPACTEGYEGFFHLCEVRGGVEHAVLDYIVRDHDSALFEKRKEQLRAIEIKMREKYGEYAVKLTLKEQYRNMAEIVRQHYHLIENAKAAAFEAGAQPRVIPIRGGTDGAMLCYKGLPCPNIGTGGYGFHGPYEHITEEGMETVVRMILALIKKYAG